MKVQDNKTKSCYFYQYSSILSKIKQLIIDLFFSRIIVNE